MATRLIGLLLAACSTQACALFGARTQTPANPPADTTAATSVRQTDTATAYPRTVAEAVTSALSKMSDTQKSQLRRMRRDEVPGMLHGFQMSARHDLGLSSSEGNAALLRSCGSATMVLEECLLVVLDAMWLELNKSARQLPSTLSRPFLRPQLQRPTMVDIRPD
jgi:hypothetical protein